MSGCITSSAWTAYYNTTLAVWIIAHYTVQFYVQSSQTCSYAELFSIISVTMPPQDLSRCKISSKVLNSVSDLTTIHTQLFPHQTQKLEHSMLSFFFTRSFPSRNALKYYRKNIISSINQNHNIPKPFHILTENYLK